MRLPHLQSGIIAPFQHTGHVCFIICWGIRFSSWKCSMPQTSSRKLRKQPRRDSPFTDKLIAEIREFARVFGVDFFSVISRGSQFKVESFMFRIAKPESFVLRSPSKHEVTRPIFEITSL